MPGSLALLRSEVAARYQAQPRGAPTDPGAGLDRLNPRWRWLSVSVAALVVVVLYASWVQVPLGPSGVVAGAQDSNVVLSFPGFQPPSLGSDVELITADGTSVSGVLRDTYDPNAGVQMLLLLVEVPSDQMHLFSQGSRVGLSLGTASLIAELLR